MAAVALVLSGITGTRAARRLDWLEARLAVEAAAGEICRRCSEGLPPEIYPKAPRATDPAPRTRA